MNPDHIELVLQFNPFAFELKQITNAINLFKSMEKDYVLLKLMKLSSTNQLYFFQISNMFNLFFNETIRSCYQIINEHSFE